MDLVEIAPEVPLQIKPEHASRLPFGVAILEIARGCNIACDYCYKYTKPDQSWRSQPPFMEEDVLAATADRAIEHMVTNNSQRMVIAFHGGEPLLAEHTRPGYFSRAVEIFETARRVSQSEARFVYGLQTNGSFLTRERAEMLGRLGVKIGVSIDGTKVANDRHRLDPQGESTYDKAAAAIRLLAEYNNRQATTIVTIDLRNNPQETYDHVRSLGADHIEFGLPHATWDDPPPGYKGPLEPMGYGKWLSEAFDCWWNDPWRGGAPLFSEIINLIRGRPGGLEYFGPAIPDVVTIRTDGSIADVDNMTVTGSNGLNLQLNVREHSLDDALDHPKVRARQMGNLGLAMACQICPAKDICAGGYVTHRFKAGSNPGVAFDELNEFINRSVYCADLYQLVTHIYKKMAELSGSLGRMTMKGHGYGLRV